MQMTQLTIPDEVYQWAQRVAQSSSQSVDEVLLSALQRAAEALPMLPASEEAELAALRYLSDDALWTIAHETLPPATQQQMQALMDKNTQGTLSNDEGQTLATLVERGNRLTLRKSEAMALLTQRGHSVALRTRTDDE